jgi:hypothetical protein
MPALTSKPVRTKKTSNIILRVTDKEHTTINLKSKLFNKKKSDYLRHTALSHWEDVTDTKHFKVLLRMYQEGSDAVKKEVVELLFHYYKRHGFPYQVLSDEEKENRMRRVMNAKNILLEDDVLQMNPQGVDLANSFHSHMMSAYYKRGEKSPLETFNNDTCLRDCINRWLELGKTPNHSGMRRILKTRDGSRGVVNWKPTIAKFIYDTYVPENGSVLDPCSGYGGRLVGCIASNKNILYHGIDPNGDTAVGNMEIASFFSKQYDIFGKRVYNYTYRFDMGCAEEVMPLIKERYDCIFSSPPFYSTEIYSEDRNQSSHRYETYKKWLDEFLFRIVGESFRILKDGGRLILNVKNLQYHKISDDLCRYCSKDWLLEKTYKMRLANSEFFRTKDNAFHHEPVFIFRKK